VRSDLSTALTDRTALFERHLRAAIAGQPPVQSFYQMMAYHLGWLDEQLREGVSDAGKRLRPALCTAACESVGSTPDDALPGALAVELVHNASLVHDDIEDGDERRRNRPAVWAVWGLAHGVNVGDGLFLLAHLAVLEAGASRGTTVAAVAATTLSRACLELFEGQHLDLEFQSRPSVSLSEYLSMIDRKTGALFGCATELGALLGGADAGLVRRLRQFGRALGRAFQMQDDLLGVWGDASVTGKPAADVAKRKRGLPAVIAWESASPSVFAELRDLYCGDTPMDEGARERALALFAALHVREQAQRLVTEEFEAALELLPSAGQPDTTALSLRQLAWLVSARSS
jgi:geranylgeranyl diphosphate synthase type I